MSEVKLAKMLFAFDPDSRELSTHFKTRFDHILTSCYHVRSLITWNYDYILTQSNACRNVI